MTSAGRVHEGVSVSNEEQLPDDQHQATSGADQPADETTDTTFTLEVTIR